MTDTDETPEHDALLRACAAGERDALHRLYLLEARRMTGIALRILRDRALAEDVVQDVFVRVWQKASTFDPARGTGRGWLYTVLRHRALNVVRERAPQVSLDEGADAVIDAWAAQQDVGAAPLAEAGALRDCLEQLEPSRRHCIVLAYVEGCSHGEIAERLATPLGTVKAWIRRGLLALRTCLG